MVGFGLPQRLLLFRIWAYGRGVGGAWSTTTSVLGIKKQQLCLRLAVKIATAMIHVKTPNYGATCRRFRRRTLTLTLTLELTVTLTLFLAVTGTKFLKGQKRHPNIGQYRVIFPGFFCRAGVGVRKAPFPPPLREDQLTIKYVLYAIY